MAEAPDFEVDFQIPDPRLEGLVSGYHRYAATLPAGHSHHDIFFPAWANIRFLVEGDFWRVRIGERHFDVPRAALFGPSSHAGFTESGTGVMVGAGITPLGWYRLTRRYASDFADRIVPLDTLLTDAAALWDAAQARPEQLKAGLDSLFLRLLGSPREDEMRVARLHAELMEPAAGGVADLGERLGMSQRTLNRVAKTAFGFGPKLLIRRARFLRSLLALRDAPSESWASRIESSYYDHSHFNRDAQEFLGMSPGEFLRMAKPLNDASARLRARILGQPAQALLTPRLTGNA